MPRIKSEANKEELKNSATKTATTALNGFDSLLGGNKINRLEKENAQLRKEVSELSEQVERLHSDMQKLKDSHARELNRTNEQHQHEVSSLKRLLDKAYDGSRASSISSTWNVSVWIVASMWNRPTNCYTARLSIIVGGFTQMSIGATRLPITSRHK